MIYRISIFIDIYSIYYGVLRCTVLTCIFLRIILMYNTDIYDTKSYLILFKIINYI